MTSSPVPTTATGGAEPGPAARAPEWAAASIPRARPDTTTTPASASPRPKSDATRVPYRVADRVPTTATAGRASSTDGSPDAHRTAGAPGSPTRAAGYPDRPGRSTSTPAAV